MRDDEMQGSEKERYLRLIELLSLSLKKLTTGTSKAPDEESEFRPLGFTYPEPINEKIIESLESAIAGLSSQIFGVTQRFENTIQNINTWSSNASENITILDRVIGEMKAAMATKISEHENRLDGLEARLDQWDIWRADATEMFRIAEARSLAMIKSIADLEVRFANLEDRYASILEAISDHPAVIKLLQTVDVLKSDIVRLGGGEI